MHEEQLDAWIYVWIETLLFFNGTELIMSQLSSKTLNSV